MELVQILCFFFVMWLRYFIQVYNKFCDFIAVKICRNLCLCEKPVIT